MEPWVVKFLILYPVAGFLTLFLLIFWLGDDEDASGNVLAVVCWPLAWCIGLAMTFGWFVKNFAILAKMAHDWARNHPDN